MNKNENFLCVSQFQPWASPPPGKPQAFEKIGQMPGPAGNFVGKCPAPRSYYHGQMPDPPLHPTKILVANF